MNEQEEQEASEWLEEIHRYEDPVYFLEKYLQPKILLSEDEKYYVRQMVGYKLGGIINQIIKDIELSKPGPLGFVGTEGMVEHFESNLHNIVKPFEWTEPP